MNKNLLVKLFLVSLAVSFIMDTVIVGSIRMLNETGEGPIRNPAIRFMARVIEKGSSYQQTLQSFEAMRARIGLRVLPVWIVDGSGKIDAQISSGPLPVAWNDLTKPRIIHGIAAHYRSFQLTPDMMILRLKAPRPTYLLVKIPQTGAIRRGFLGWTIFLFATMAASAFAGLLITFVYLRQKSREAKQILGRLEKGDLKARFPISRLDELGSLMTDFNRMANAIESLVSRVEDTDRSRQELLHELGHDLRTPMTSLKAAVDTIADHSETMSPAHRERFLKIIRSESEYFLRMIDDLFFIAEVGDPKYRKTAENIDLTALVQSEIRIVEEGVTPEKEAVDFQFNSPESPIILSGDPVLLKRMMRNALQNARRYAASKVEIALESVKKNHDGGSMARIVIRDDGSGISSEDAILFGKRRPRKLSCENDLSNSEISLGLGSVIMSAIASVHGGRIAISNRQKSDPVSQGTELVIELPV